LGRFDLVGIPPAPRGVPQIEVTFDIDANGILHVSAKDKGTNKEHSMRIERPGSLSEEEINRMVKEAEAHADEDKQRKEMIEAKNKLDTLIFSTEKSMADYADKLSDSEKTEIEAAIKEAKEKLEKGQTAAEYNEAAETLSKRAQKLGEILYKNMQEQQGAQGGAGGFNPEDFMNQANNAQEQAKPTNDGPVDAEFEVVDDK
ncbi:MAG TPA: Hsp70 family protein, partial [Candidatus Cloacimonadota bacterium]|nr:Hsp70 family protein [Candidatus Cloacimonadota bacterium]